MSTSRKTTLVKLYTPKLSTIRKLGGSALLVGVTSLTESSSGSSNQKPTRYTHHCQASIYGVFRYDPDRHSQNVGEASAVQQSWLHSTNSFLQTQRTLSQILGYYGKTENEAAFEIISLRSKSALWIRFNDSGALQEVLVNGVTIPLTDVILLEYDPKPLSHCLTTSSSTQQQMSLVPEILADSFTFPSNTSLKETLTLNFVRLIPEHRSQSAAPSCADGEDGFSLGIPSAIRSRSSALEEILNKLLVLSQLLQNNSTWVFSLNVIGLIMLDVFLGTLFTNYLKRLIPSYDVYEDFCKVVLEMLLKLLDWLSGAPAGLKLNAELNSLFHSFYSYHLHLWEGYMDLVKPLMKLLCFGVVNLGPLGLTTQLTLAKDLLSLTTFHIYCLYIYATRLFYIELNTLKSLGRLIMGRKWNPLRERIDSVTMSVSELFLGAFGFTVAIFLFPTICIYYVVFLALRLPILFLEFLLKFCTQLFNSVEIITAILIFTNSEWVGDEVYLKPSIPPRNVSPTYAHYEIKTQTTNRTFYKVPSFRKSLIETISYIFESRVITN